MKKYLTLKEVVSEELKDKEFKKLEEIMDLKMKEYISVIQSNDPHEKSKLIADLGKKYDIIAKKLDELYDRHQKLETDLNPMLKAFKQSFTMTVYSKLVGFIFHYLG